MQEFKFTQASPSASWVINHNLNDYPVVEVILADGRKILPGTMRHTNMNTMLVTFQTPQAGVARLIGSKLAPLPLVDTNDWTDRGFVVPEPPGQVNEFFVYPAGPTGSGGGNGSNLRVYVFSYNPYTQTAMPLDADTTLVFTNADPGTPAVNAEWPNPLTKITPSGTPGEGYTVDNAITVQMLAGESLKEFTYPFYAATASFDRALPIKPVSTTYRSFTDMDTKWGPVPRDNDYS